MKDVVLLTGALGNVGRTILSHLHDQYTWRLLDNQSPDSDFPYDLIVADILNTTAVKEAVEKSPPEIIADLIDKGVILAGGGALIKGFDKFLEKRLKLPIVILNDPLMSVARGTEILLDEIELLEKVKVVHDDLL